MQSHQSHNNSESLPPGWEMGYDSATGMNYYIDHNTMTTTWLDPRKQQQQRTQNQSGWTMPSNRDHPAYHYQHSPHVTNQPRHHQHQKPHPMYPYPQTTDQSMYPYPRTTDQWSTGHADIPVYPHPSNATNQGVPLVKEPPVPQPASVHHIERGAQLNRPPAASQHQQHPQQPHQQPQAQPHHQQTLDVPDSAGGRQGSRETTPSAGNDIRRQRSPSPHVQSCLEAIRSIEAEVQELEQRVLNFKEPEGKKAKEYKYLEEMLTRVMLKLDNVQSEGEDDVRQARRSLIRTAQTLLDQLELKAMSQ